MKQDTGTISEVPEQLRLDVDEGEGSDASDDTSDLEDVYANPGKVVSEEELT